jgi:hypothetical protein
MGDPAHVSAGSAPQDPEQSERFCFNHYDLGFLFPPFSFNTFQIITMLEQYSDINVQKTKALMVAYCADILIL